MAEKEKAAAMPTTGRAEKLSNTWDDGAVEKVDVGDGIISTYPWVRWFAWRPVYVPGAAGIVWLRTVERRVTLKTWSKGVRTIVRNYRPATLSEAENG